MSRPAARRRLAIGDGPTKAAKEWVGEVSGIEGLCRLTAPRRL